MATMTEEDRRANRAAYMRQWRAETKGKPKPKRRRKPGRPKLPRSPYAENPAQWAPLGGKVAGTYARQHRWEFHESKLGTDGPQHFESFRTALIECAKAVLVDICRRTPQLEKPAAYLLKSLQRRCLVKFDRIRLSYLGRWASVPANRRVRDAILKRIDRHRHGMRATHGLEALMHQGAYETAVAQAEEMGLIDPGRPDRRSTTGHFSGEYDEDRLGLA